MGISPLRFTGISQFSQDFQLIVDRTLQIASLPARALQNDQARLFSQKSALANLRNPVAALASSLRSLGRLGDTRALTATSSQAGKVGVTLPDAVQAQPGTFTISEVTSLAQRTIVTSALGQASATSGPVAGLGGVVELVVGGETFELTLAADKDHFEGLRDAINARGAGVTASLINANGEVFLSIAANQTGSAAIEVRTEAGNPASNLMAVTQAGADAVFKVNGQQVTSSENYVEDVIPGVGLTIKELTSGSETILVDIRSSRTPVSNALKTFINAFNDLNSQLGEASAGTLSGQSLVRDVSARMRMIAGQFGEGAIRSLAEIGVTIDRNGVMSLQDAAFSALPESRMGDVFEFLREGAAGLSALAGKFEELSDPVEGTMVAQLRAWDDTDARLQKQIDAIMARANDQQLTLMTRLQAADALLARLDSQQSLLDATIKSLELTMYGKKDR